MLDGHVLVLNRVFQAVQITSVRRALTLLYKGQVRAVDSEYRTYDFENWADIPVQADDDHYVRTPSRNILIPHVVQLLVFDRLPRQEVKFSRGNIYLRDGNRCQYCGKKFSSSELSLDHVVPISRGGKSTWENVVCACLPCNVRKGNKLLSESGHAADPPAASARSGIRSIACRDGTSPTSGRTSSMRRTGTSSCRRDGLRRVRLRVSR